MRRHETALAALLWAMLVVLQLGVWVGSVAGLLVALAAASSWCPP